MLNEYVWKTYLQSGGNAVVEMFRRNLEEELTQEFVEKIREFHSVYLLDERELNDESEQLCDLIKIMQENPDEQSDDNFDATSMDVATQYNSPEEILA